MRGHRGNGFGDAGTVLSIGGSEWCSKRPMEAVFARLCREAEKCVGEAVQCGLWERQTGLAIPAEPCRGGVSEGTRTWGIVDSVTAEHLASPLRFCCLMIATDGRMARILTRLGHAGMNDANWHDQCANGTKPLE